MWLDFAPPRAILQNVSFSNPQHVAPSPRRDPAAVQLDGEQRGPGPTSDILVVDDSAELIEWMRLDLEGRGYRVETALSGEECVCRVEELRPPCVLLDVMMPGAPRLAKLLEDHKALRAESTVLLDESVYVVAERGHKPLYDILTGLGSELPLLRDEKNRLLVYQKADDLYPIVADSAFEDKYGEVRIHLDGYTTCQLVTSCTRFKGVHIILFTAGGPGTRNERVQRAFQAGASDYLLKSEYYTHLFERIELYVNARS
jgi:CheY-like chemotaxis protein